MKNRFVLLIGVLVLVCLIAYMCCFTVPYNQTALLKTFKRADKESVITEPGLYFKWPSPFQTVDFFGSSLHVLDAPLQNQQLKDQNLLLLKCFVNWKVTDPYNFSIQVNNANKAEGLLRTHVATAVSTTVGRYELKDFFGKGKQKEIEAIALGEIQKIVKEQGYGIEVKNLGFRRVELHGSVTPEVFETMKVKSENIATKVVTTGKNDAATMRDNADTAAERILAFAKRRAESERSKGRKEAAELLKEFKANPELAIILEKQTTLEETLGGVEPGVTVTVPLNLIVGEESQGKKKQ